MGPSRRAAAFGLLAYVIGSLGGYLHFALVRHERCPEHGELIHADSAEAGVLTPPVDARPEQADSSVVSAGSRAEDSHDPCFTVASLRERWCLRSGVQEGPRCAVLERAAPPSSEAIRAGAVIWQLAPKTSPPSAHA
jgi:hypothetical protein